jgi:AraC-like DNA-binding protein
VGQIVLKSRHPTEPSVRGYAVTHPPGTAVLPIEIGWDQLLYAASGVMTVSTSAGTWVVPPHRALWVPDGAPATIHTRTRVAVRTLYLDAQLGALVRATRAVNVPALGRELLLHAVETSPLDLRRPVDAALLTLLLDQLRTLPDAPLQLPRPLDARAAAVAAGIVEDPAADLTDLAAGVGAARRTLERLFRHETGMTLGNWRRRARMLRALELLTAGASVTTTATTVGYATPSSFVAAFRAELGAAPRQFLRSARQMS